MDTNLLNMFKSTYGGAVRDRQAQEAETMYKQSASKANEAAALNSMFQTKKGEALLPTDISKARFETSPEMQQATLGKTQAEADKLKAESQQAIMNMDDAKLVAGFKEGITLNKNALSSAQSYLAAGYSVKDALAAISAEMPEDKRNDPKFQKMIMQYSRMNPQQASAQIDIALKKIVDIEAKSDDPAYVRQMLLGEQQMAQEKTRGEFRLGRERLQAERQSKGEDIPKTDAQMRQKYIDEKRAAEKGIAMYNDWAKKNPGKKMDVESWENYQGLKTQLERANSQLDPILNKQVVTPSSLPGMPDRVQTTFRGSGQQEATSDPNLDRLPKGSKALGNGIYELPDGTKVRAN